MDNAIKEEEIDKIREIVEKNEKIDHLDKITSKSVGNKFIVIIKFSVDGSMTVSESHQIAGKLKADIMESKCIYDVVVHVNPV